MGAPELFIEHRQGERVKKFVRVRTGTETFLIGSSREADLRLAGDDISGCHAVLRFRHPHWYLCDLSGTDATRVGQERVIEAKLDGSVEIEIGKHKLKLFAKERNDNLFKGDEAAEKGLALHQVVVRSRGRVIETRILKATEPFRYHDGVKTADLAAPTSSKWQVLELGNCTIQQRLVPAQAIAAADGIKIDQGLKKPLAVFLAIALLLTTIGLLMPSAQKPNVEAQIDKKSAEMIFNAKTIKKKRVESAKVAAAKVRQGGNSRNAQMNHQSRVTPEESMAPKSNPKAAAALNSLRNSGLNSLIGKIAKRANKQGVMVAATGVAPDKEGSGRAFYSAGTSLNGGGGFAAKEGNTFKLGGIGTKGKAGGAGNFKDGTALAGGSVGQGNVMIADEESMVDGGLDRDVIAEVIKRNLGQIRYCYERQLSSNPDLYGKVMVRFTIGAAGDVGDPKIDNSTMKNAMVEGCILRRLAGWKFPQPKGGTLVKVSYPFLFKAMD